MISPQNASAIILHAVKVSLQCFYSGLITREHKTLTRLHQGSCFKPWMEVPHSHTKQMHNRCISVCLCTQMLRENGQRRCVCAYPQIRSSIVKTVSLQFSVREEQKTIWLKWPLRFGGVVVRCCAVLLPLSIACQTQAEGDGGMLQGADSLWTRHRSHLALVHFWKHI